MRRVSPGGTEHRDLGSELAVSSRVGGWSAGAGSRAAQDDTSAGRVSPLPRLVGREKQGLSAELSDAPPTSKPQDSTGGPPREGM